MGADAVAHDGARGPHMKARERVVTTIMAVLLHLTVGVVLVCCLMAAGALAAIRRARSALGRALAPFDRIIVWRIRTTPWKEFT